MGPQLTDFLGRSDEHGGLGGAARRARLVTLIGPGGVGKTRLGARGGGPGRRALPTASGWSELGPAEPGSNVVGAIAGSLGITQREAAPTTSTRSSTGWRPRPGARGARQLRARDRTPSAASSSGAPSVPRGHGARDQPGGARPRRRAPLADQAAAVPPPGVTTRTRPSRTRRSTCSWPGRATPDGTSCSAPTTSSRWPASADGSTASPSPSSWPRPGFRHSDPRTCSTTSTSGSGCWAGRARERRRTLRGTVDWSYGLLDDLRTVLFRRLTVFAGGWTLDACRSVCAGGELRPADIVGVLAELVAKSLVTWSPRRRHPIPDARDVAGLRAGAPRRGRRGRGPGQGTRCGPPAWSNWLRPGSKRRDERASGDLLHDELGNLRAALRWATTNLDAEVAFRIIAGWRTTSSCGWTSRWPPGPKRCWSTAGLGRAPAAAPGPGPRRLRRVGERRARPGATISARRRSTVERRHAGPPSWAARQAVADAAWFRGLEDAGWHAFEELGGRRPAGRRRLRPLLGAGPSRRSPSCSAAGSRAARALADEALELARRCGSPFLIALALYAISEA